MKLLYPFVMMAAVCLFSCEKGGGDGTEKSTDLSSGLYAGGASGGSSGSTGNNSNPGQVTPQPGLITAGEWNDLSHWDFWQSLQDKDVFKDVKSSYRYDLATKVTVKLISDDHMPLIDEPVLIKKSDGSLLWEARTDNKGIAQLFIGSTQKGVAFNVYVPERGYNAPGVYSTETREYQVPVTAGIVSNADVAFVVDATGSMGDELYYLKTELLDVINQAKSANSNNIIRTGAVFYRDEGDDYVTKRSDFTSNSTSTLDFIRNQSAGGGGDFPEAVHTAVKEAVQQLAWSSKAKCRILFLVLDAPPHDNDAVMATLAEQVKAAAKKGIRIVPITASGINKLTEYLMRQMSIATNGTYVFITNDSGIGNNHLEPTVGEYKVEYLNNLMVRLINQYLE